MKPVAQIIKDACHIMAGECPDAMSPRNLGDHSYVVYLVVEGVDAYDERVVAHDVEIVKPLRDGPWGMREFDSTCARSMATG